MMAKIRHTRPCRLDKNSEESSSQDRDQQAEDTSDSAFQTVLEDVRVQKAVRWACEDAHKLRLKQMKASLTKHIDDTEWMFDSLDTILGFSK
ncbi:Hypothetical predicted protein [Cloeon dipterum]|uniref:Uncharacterized protein n=1 Tax=Cloeon dipterum TaxID=197152 RepID=A0A8S1CYX5_9INSE|nr:Hypothetical predicted protein [Cloeon dipterum]